MIPGSPRDCSQQVQAGRPTAVAAPAHDGGSSKVGPIQVSLAEISKRSRKGLCWHCPEKYVPGHVCAVKLLCYVGDDDEDIQEEDQECQQIDDHVITAYLSHLHSLDGNNHSRPFSVQGNIGAAEVGVLIDTGSTHDFLHPRFAESLQLFLTPIRPFRVYMGNGASILCSHVSHRTKLTLQGEQFIVDLHILGVHGADVILGMAWLESLGKVWADFVGKTLEFRRGERTIVLTSKQQRPKELSLHSLLLLASYSPAHEFYEIVPLEPEEQPSTLLTVEASFPVDLQPEIRAVQDSNRQVFELPVGMSPKRVFDHKIHLFPITKPVNVRRSPFSSPVLLIRRRMDHSGFALITGL